MAFNNRIIEAQGFENSLFREIEDMGFVVAKNGTEHTHPTFVAGLRQSLDPTSLAIRFQPDGVACIGTVPRSFFVEAKNAKNIEKAPYDHYMQLYSIGHLVVLVFGKLNSGWNFVEAIRLIPGEETVGRFPPEVRFPVRDHWIVPRNDARVANGSFHVAGASFTPYREISPASLLPWASFKSSMLARLVGVA